MKGGKEIYFSLFVFLLALTFAIFREPFTAGIVRITGLTQWSSVAEATVTVLEYISATLFNVPIQFGDLNPGTSGQLAINNPMQIQIGGETNVPYNITLEGTSNFVSGSYTFSISNLEFNTTTTQWTQYELNVEKDAYTNLPPPGGTPVNQSVWHRISVPAGQVAGTYVGNLMVRVKKA
ncbi:MAG: hypothetical protein QW507_01290 [Candidatus Nanoarchaeia archaeon]|nr:hypothetical protein [Candidatus Haiyanarchaeum thermophilum]MCW1303863.1 hypothetical protein [Candidatus Haiyanarchaeum thermophilum]MCW1306521.1 hypothetical protein [Candidatus Haiyanarchaeum thermophilum]MCW1306934.1 hypothetical protein [Candidatus Haiyanarchaeum thermophilum]MCW1307605.1 hypothetical protein [Candidatus Haiyanarchaeum thermophilum]